MRGRLETFARGCDIRCAQLRENIAYRDSNSDPSAVEPTASRYTGPWMRETAPKRICLDVISSANPAFQWRIGDLILGEHSLHYVQSSFSHTHYIQMIQFQIAHTWAFRRNITPFSTLINPPHISLSSSWNTKNISCFAYLFSSGFFVPYWWYLYSQFRYSGALP
jgi:hypothetical protein